MMRGVLWFLVGSFVLLVLAGCGRNWFAEREAWRREAEEQCLKSGAVRQGPAVALARPIQGPGVCGADYPLRVAALGESAVPARDQAEWNPVSRPDHALNDKVRARTADKSTQSAQAGLLSAKPVSTFADRALSYADEALRPPAAIPQSGAPFPPLDRPPVAVSSSYPLPPVTSVPLGPSRAQPYATGRIKAAVMPEATLACPLVSALDRWVANAVQPAAQKWFGQPVAEIKQISAYACRGMNGNSNARISEHAFGNALDISAFTLADGRQINVKDGWRGAPEEQGFLRDVQGAACAQFSTVLAPGSNIYHYDHIHVDLMRRASGQHICNPEAVPGEVVAARARMRYGSRLAHDQEVTGSLRPGSAPRIRRHGAEPLSDDIDDDRQHPLPLR
jgi:hypothetical protein